MKSTYLNDGFSTVYPFAFDAVLPFPLHCITGCGICLGNKDRDNPVTECPAVYISSLELSPTRVVARVAIDVTPEPEEDAPGDAEVAPVYEDVCTLVWADGKSVVSEQVNDKWWVGGWISPGLILPEDAGTYAGMFRLDESCIIQINRDVLGDISHLLYYPQLNTDDITDESKFWYINKTLSINIDGWLETTAITQYEIENVDAPGLYWLVSADIPEGAQVNVSTDEYDAYPMVEAINNGAIDGTLRSDTYAGTLVLEPKLPPGAGEDEKIEDYVKISINNAHRCSDVSTTTASWLYASPQNGRRNEFRASLFQSLSDAVVVTVTGLKKFPSCYDAEDDEADDDMGGEDKDEA